MRFLNSIKLTLNPWSFWLRSSDLSTVKHPRQGQSTFVRAIPSSRSDPLATRWTRLEALRGKKCASTPKHSWNPTVITEISNCSRSPLAPNLLMLRPLISVSTQQSSNSPMRSQPAWPSPFFQKSREERDVIIVRTSPIALIPCRLREFELIFSDLSPVSMARDSAIALAQSDPNSFLLISRLVSALNVASAAATALPPANPS
mmetsp:Transcript_60293/g.126187  ORF Transcript_60293/g.126187 Transcript_60293/m.126187 type:complete len:203 (+) Transcript_60293:919-1527(+)